MADNEVSALRHKVKASPKRGKAKGSKGHASNIPGEVIEVPQEVPLEQHTTELISARDEDHTPVTAGQLPQEPTPRDRSPSGPHNTSDMKKSSRPSSARNSPVSPKTTDKMGDVAGPSDQPEESAIWKLNVEGFPGKEKFDGDLSLTLRPEAYDKAGNTAKVEIDFPASVVDVEAPPVEKQKEYQPLDYEKGNFHSLDPKNYGIEFDDEEFQYEMMQRDANLPDLYRLMASLEDGGSDLESERDPPSLFTQPEHVPRYKKISELKLRLEEEEISPYVDDFEEGVKDDVLMIGSITLGDVQEEERRLRDEHINYQEQEALTARHRQQEVVIKEEEAKKRVARDLKEKRKLIKRRQEILHQKERLMLDRIHKAFRRAENQLISKLNFRKGEVTTMYGDLTVSDGHYGGSKGRRWKVDWEKTPQPVQIKLRSLRGIRDKLPAGRYVLMASLYNRLGGHVLHWSNLKGQLWGGTTLPLHHDGHFYNTELKVDQSVFTVLPSKPGIRPGMVLVFELFLLRGATVATDRVVSWGCFPVTDGRFDVIEGKYKAPFLRGEMDPQISKHEKFEELISSDIDHWMANLYFEIIKLPRYLAGQKEYEVELQFSSGLLSYPDRINTAGEKCRDGEVPVPGSMPQIEQPQGGSTDASNFVSDMDLTIGNLQRSSIDLQPGTSSQEAHALDKPPAYHSNYSELLRDPYYRGTKRPASTSSESIGSTEGGRMGVRQRRRPMTTVGSRSVHNAKSRKINATSGDESEEDSVYLMDPGSGFYPIKGQPGMYYKKYANNPVDEYHKELFTLLPKTPILSKKRQKKKLTYQKQLEQHSFAVSDPFSDKGHVSQQSSEKLSYVRRQFMAELGLSQWRSREFWGMVIMFILIFFLRLYLHYVGQWLLLQALGIPINKFDFLPYSVNLNYQSTLLTVREQIGIVLTGPFFIIVLFAMLVFLVWVLQRTVGNCPDIVCRFVMVFGMQAFLDWLLILTMDAALQRYQNLGGAHPIADFAKLYWNFYTAEGSGIAGILITIFLYLFCCFIAGAILYMYFLRLHNNGRMLDIYWRLHGTEEMFFIAHDLEVSNQELSYVLKHAEQWRGEEGERRKVAVYDYVWQEEPSAERGAGGDGETGEVGEGRTEVTTHISVHTVHLDGLRELYRHFLRLPNGAIVEVFGDPAMSGLDKKMNTALSEGTSNLENVLSASQARLNKISERKTRLENIGVSPDNEEDLTRFLARRSSSVSRPSSNSSLPKKCHPREIQPDKDI